MVAAGSLISQVDKYRGIVMTTLFTFYEHSAPTWHAYIFSYVSEEWFWRSRCKTEAWCVHVFFLTTVATHKKPNQFCRRFKCECFGFVSPFAVVFSHKSAQLQTVEHTIMRVLFFSSIFLAFIFMYRISFCSLLFHYKATESRTQQTAINTCWCRVYIALFK